MKLTHYFLVPALLGCFALGCSDKDIISPENSAHASFQQMYPEASAVEWETERNHYKVEFRIGNQEKEAWFNQSGEWELTETDLSYAALPEAVKRAHEAGDFKDWKVDDVDLVERKSHEAIYVLEVERGSLEYDLYYLADGTLVKAFPDDDNDNDYLPVAIPAKVSTFLKEKYPNHKVVDTDVDERKIEVEFIDGKFKREAEFTKDGDWTYTETEVSKGDVPESILTVLGTSEYRSYRIDDIDFIETPAGNYYLFELELGNSEVDVKIHENGNLEVVN